MASTPETMSYICDQAHLGNRLTYRRMFGEYALYLDGKVIALVCDNQLYLKPTDAGRRLLSDATEAAPYPGARAHLLISAELDDPEQLRRLLLATGKALPVARKRRKSR